MTKRRTVPTDARTADSGCPPHWAATSVIRRCACLRVAEPGGFGATLDAERRAVRQVLHLDLLHAAEKTDGKVLREASIDYATFLLVGLHAGKSID